MVAGQALTGNGSHAISAESWCSKIVVDLGERGAQHSSQEDFKMKSAGEDRYMADIDRSGVNCSLNSCMGQTRVKHNKCKAGRQYSCPPTVPLLVRSAYLSPCL